MNDPAYSEHLAGNRYYDRHFDIEAVKVLPGEYFVTTTDMVLVTVLGSCVSACIRDREKGIGGLNHFMLADGANSLGSASARYGGYAMEVLINHLLNKCCKISFGGFIFFPVEIKPGFVIILFMFFQEING